MHEQSVRGCRGVLAERLIPVSDYGIKAASGCWVAVVVRGKTPDRLAAFVSVYRPPGSLGGVVGSLVHRYQITDGAFVPIKTPPYRLFVLHRHALDLPE